MKLALCCVALALATACREKAPTRSEARSRYVRPDIAALLEVAQGADGERFEADARRSIATDMRGHPAARALWAGVEQAEEIGLEEMYGVEAFHDGYTDYDALLFVRTRPGRVHCLLANGQDQRQRTDADSVPTISMTLAPFELLARRIAVELPLRNEVDMAGGTLGGVVYVLHLYRGGVSHHALWYALDEPWSRYREMATRYREAYPAAAIVNAMYAAAPAEKLPLYGDFGWYDRAPAFLPDPQPR